MRGVVVAASLASRTASPGIAGTLLRTQPDGRLTRLAGEGSEAAFEEIVRRYRSGLVGFASGICASHAAEDVVQDSMVKALAALRRGDRPDNPRAWLFRIVRNTALNNRRDTPVHEHLDESYDGVEQPPEAADRRRQLRDLVSAMRDLPRAQRHALVQRELEGRGHEEIAAELHVSPGAVRQLIFRARTTLRAGLGALVPIQILRFVALSGAEPTSGAAGAGLGFTAVKVGLGAVLATGALVAGDEVRHRANTSQQAPASKAAPAATAAEQVGAAEPLSRGSSPGNGSARGGSSQADSRVKRARAKVVNPKPAPPVHDPYRDNHPKPPPPSGGGGGDHQDGGGGGRTGQSQPTSFDGSTQGTAPAPDGSAQQYQPPA